MRLQPAMIEAAVQAGVTHFYPSEWNSDISQKEIYDMRYFRDKQMTRSHLAATAKEHPDFQYTLFVTGIFTEWSVLEFYGFDHEAATAEIYGRPDARVGVTSIPEYVFCPLALLALTLSTNPKYGDSRHIEVELIPFLTSIAHYTISSLLLLPSSTHPSSARTIRVGGSSQPFSTLIETLSRVRGREYTVTYLDAAAAAAKQEEARVAGDEVGETVWSIKPLLAGGHGVADGRGETLDNGLFDFVPETLEETFERIYAAGAD